MGKKKTGQKKVKRVIIDEPRYSVVKVRLVGTSPLIMNRLHDMSLKKHNQKTVTDKDGEKKPAELRRGAADLRDLKKEYEMAAHINPATGKPAIPCSAIKAAILEASVDFEGVTKASLRRGLRVLGEYADLSFESVVRREDYPRQSGKTRAPYLRVRPQFNKWSTTVTIRFFEGILNLSSVVNLIKYAGEAIGLLEWRPSSKMGTGGNYGCFEVQPV